jgi:hypothetical protein
MSGEIRLSYDRKVVTGHTSTFSKGSGYHADNIGRDNLGCR